MLCPECGQENQDNAAFCRFCGSSLQAAADTQQAQGPTQAPAAAAAAPAAPPPQAAAPGGPSTPFSEELAPTSLAALVKESLEVESPNAFNLQNKKLLRVNMAASGGSVLAKAGSMIAYQGQISFSRQGSGGAAKWVKKAVSGEAFTLMLCQGTGDLFLADASNDIVLIYLNNEAITVEALNLLAFSPSISWDIKMIKGAAGMMSGGLWTVELTGTGYLALISKGEPMTMKVTPEQPTFTDPNATIAWSQSLNPTIHMDANLGSLKGLLGSRHGELFQLAFQGDGFVVVQPSEVAPSTSLQDPRGGGSGTAGGILGGILGQ
ncbi:MAG: AIM24 family protein [Actinomycetota bacterium]|nr:AIM24 family protein [Actinomycetota bacterium]MDD5668265.1 AIM24 family protein [Actinomycetota bacterium]